MISRITDEARYYGWLAVNYMMIAMPLGMYISVLCFTKKQKVKTMLSTYTLRDIEVVSRTGGSSRYSLILFTALSAMSCFYVFYTIGYNPILKVLSSGTDDLSILRMSASRGFEGNVYVRNILALTLMPILSYIWCFYLIKTRYVIDFFFFAGTFILSVSILYYDFSKSPVLWYLLSFIFVIYYSTGKLNISFAFLVFIIVATLLSVFYAFSGVPVSDFISYNSGPIGRILLSQSAGLYFMFDLFPSEFPHIYFDSLSALVSSLLGSDYTERAARLAMMTFNPEGIAAGTAGVMNSLYVGEAWANFGIVGVVLSPIWVGFVVQSCYIFFLRKPKSPMYLAFFVAFSVGGSITGGVNDYIYNPGVVLVVLFALMIVAVSKFIKETVNKI
ncbi:hypothetical protein [Halomonas denitrificans]|uniref:hypothetical protein n=1 Tax=Halomonas denitrificans TaxID=370769 RepID=UPI001C99DC0E|nr:hypothetical protein [Halomonas denitrificans]MBY5969541.1 hypothetical protein [Halomonas denitrificans]